MPERHECGRTGCSHEGQFSIKLVLPHRLRGSEDPRPHSAILGIRLCRRHAEEFEAKSIFDAPDPRNLREILGAIPHLTGGALDFDAAYTVPLRCSSPEFETFLRI